MTLLNVTAKSHSFQGIKLHNPTLQELADVIEDEESLFFAIKLLSSSLLSILIRETDIPQNFSDFSILFSLLYDQKTSFEMFTKEKIQAIVSLLLLIFKDYKLSLGKEEFLLTKDNSVIILNSDNFSNFQSIVSKMFKTDFIFGETGDNQYNIDQNDKKAQEILKKLNKGREKVAQLNGDRNNKTALIENYVMIIAVGLQQTPDIITNLTLYQIFTLFNRIKMKLEWDLDVDCRLAGGDPDERPDNWMSIL